MSWVLVVIETKEALFKCFVFKATVSLILGFLSSSRDRCGCLYRQLLTVITGHLFDLGPTLYMIASPCRTSLQLAESKEHSLTAGCSINSTALTLETWPPFVNESKWQWLQQLLSCTYLRDCAVTVGFWVVFWHSSSRRGRESNNCCDIPDGLIPFNFSVFLQLPDPDHILPHCGEGNILQWVEKF